MTILAEIQQQCRNLLDDTSINPKFSDSALIDFINRAIADLNQHFPRRIPHTMSATAGNHIYRLPTPAQSVLSVEYPAGQTPPHYLRRKAYTDPDFWLSTEYYDFVPTNDAYSANGPCVYISANPKTGQVISFEITIAHNAMYSPSDQTSVPDSLIHLIALFVRWKTWEALASDEGMDPNPLKSITTVHGLNAQRAEATYRAALAAAKAAYTESAITPWPFPDQDRIY